VSQQFFVVVNPAAGGGRSGKMADAALARLRAAGIDLEIAQTTAPGQGIQLARDAYARGHRQFLAVGGDGTSYEIVNGLFPEAQNAAEPPVLALLPLGTGNSFLRDFTDRGKDHAEEAILGARERHCDVFRMTHKGGTIYYINLLSMGFAADVAATRMRRFKGLGELGYLLALFSCLVRLDRRAFPLRLDGQGEPDKRRCLFLTFNNSKFTGGKMMIAPCAQTDDGLIEFVRWGPIGRLGLLRNLHTLYDGTHLNHRLASRHGVRHIDFALDAPVDVMVDGEVLTLHCERLDVLPGALKVVV
jgi:diacylglycerol kinase (ATP)